MSLSNSEAVALARRMLNEGSIYSFGAYSDARELAECVVDRMALREGQAVVHRGRERRTQGESGLCLHCGEEILLDEHRVWHHASDDAVVCGVQVATPRVEDR